MYDDGDLGSNNRVYLLNSYSSQFVKSAPEILQQLTAKFHQLQPTQSTAAGGKQVLTLQSSDTRVLITFAPYRKLWVEVLTHADGQTKTSWLRQCAAAQMSFHFHATENAVYFIEAANNQLMALELHELLSAIASGNTNSYQPVIIDAGSCAAFWFSNGRLVTLPSMSDTLQVGDAAFRVKFDKSHLPPGPVRLLKILRMRPTTYVLAQVGFEDRFLGRLYGSPETGWNLKLVHRSTNTSIGALLDFTQVELPESKNLGGGIILLSYSKGEEFIAVYLNKSHLITTNETM